MSKYKTGVALQLEYLGSCEQFNSLDSATVTISSFDATQPTCLPISKTGGLESDDLQADYFCSGNLN